MFLRSVCKWKKHLLDQPLRSAFVLLIYNFVLVQLRTSRDMVINHDQMKFFILRILKVIYCTEQHTAGFDSHHFTWRQVCDCDQGLAYQFFWLVVSVDSGKDGTVQHTL